MGAASPNLGAELTTYSFTFGSYNQTAPWTDRRALPWNQLALLLTQHAVGSKEGTCIVPATFSGGKRAKADAVQIDVVFLDSDAGFTLSEIKTAIQAKGWSAIVSSSHSHMTTDTKVKRGNWDKFCLEARGSTGVPERYLTDVKGYPPRVAKGATVVAETEEFTFFRHQPCPKFRVALPLLRSWKAASYDSQHNANSAWKERIGALAAALNLSHDQACTDTSRLFYLPRRPFDGPSAETAILDGELCDIFALPRVESKTKNRPSHAGGRQRPASKPDRIDFVDASSGECIDLTSWARQHAKRFEITTALAARRPDIFVPRPGEAPKRHIRCVNEEAHTQAGADAATFVINASDSSSRSGFIYHCRHAHCDGRDRLHVLMQMLEQGWLAIADLTDPTFLTGDGQVRPTIRFVGGEIAAIVDQAEQALIAAQLDIYQRGAFVVRPGEVSVAISHERETTTQRILEVGDYALVEMLTVAANWDKYDGRSKTWVRIDAPQKVATTYRQRVGRWRLPVLAGLINGPTLREDGSILSAPGYDPATGLLLNLAGEKFPTIPDRPTKDEGRAALAVLIELLQGFSFVQDADRSVALSAMLTAPIRRSLPTAPLHAFTAPVMGSGKSKLVDIATIMTSGRAAAVIAQGKTEEETEKRLGAMLLAGDAVIAIDNCEAPLGGDFLCQMLTQPVVRARILGRSEAPELPANAMVTATGNNLVLVGDMARRALLSRLDPQCERPELRVFKSDPVDLVQANRGKYLVSALTVLRAYHVAGLPKQRDPLGSFHQWSRRVRDALIWLDQADPVDTLDNVRRSDPKLDAITAVLTQWSEVIGSDRVSVQDVIARATRLVSNGCGVKPDFQYPSFREALLSVAGDGGSISGRRLSRWIGGNENRIVESLRIVRRGMYSGFMTWSLQHAAEG